MPTPRYTVVCTKNEIIAQDIYEIHFTKPAGFSFTAGQFILFDVPLVENHADIQTRAFSIASSPGESDLIFAMKMKEGGRASRWIQEVLVEGGQLEMQGPFGFFILPQTLDHDLLLICTSTGIAPFRSQLPGLLAGGFSKRIDLIYGVRSERDLFWKEFFEDLAKQYPNFFVHIALTQPSPEWTGHVGRVQTIIPQVISDWSTRKVYVCGNPAMTGDIKKLCLEQWGMQKQDFHMEGYI